MITDYQKAEILGLTVVLIIGALSGPKTLAHNFAVALDVFAQCFAWNKIIPITISTRAALAARAGHTFWSTLVGYLMLSWKAPLAHGEGAILADRDRNLDALSLLYDGNKEVLALLVQIGNINP